MLVRKLFMLWRIMKTGSRNFARNAWLSIAATAVMTVTLTIMLAAVVFNMALGSTLDQVTAKIDVAVFFTDEASQKKINRFQSELEQLENVTEVEFVSKSEALERYRELRSDEESSAPIEAVSEEENTLPRSVEIKMADLSRVGEISALAESQQFAPIVEDTSLEKENRRTIERIARARESLITFGLTASLIFAAISMLIIFNTIRMAIFARAEEIGIMRLVGATNSFIRGPFLFEAMLDGIIAALISLGLVYAVLFRTGVSLINYVDFESTTAFFADMWPVVVLATIGAGILIGVLSSALAMMRYLRL